MFLHHHCARNNHNIPIKYVPRALLSYIFHFPGVDTPGYQDIIPPGCSVRNKSGFQISTGSFLRKKIQKTPEESHIVRRKDIQGTDPTPAGSYVLLWIPFQARCHPSGIINQAVLFSRQESLFRN